jgi:hypothetical protein
MDEKFSSETSIEFQLIAWRWIPEYRHFRGRLYLIIPAVLDLRLSQRIVWRQRIYEIWFAIDVDVYWCFEGKHYLHLHGRILSPLRRNQLEEITFGWGETWVHLLRRLLFGLLYHPWIRDDDDDDDDGSDCGLNVEWLAGEI